MFLPHRMKFEEFIIPQQSEELFNCLTIRCLLNTSCCIEVGLNLSNLEICWKKISTFEGPRQHIKKQRHYFASKGPSSQGCSFSSSHIWRWELDCKESWVPKNWCFWTVVSEKTLESPLDCKEIQPVHPKGDHSWVFIGRTDAEAETPILWPSDVKSWLIWEDPDAGNDWRREEEKTEDEMLDWHLWVNGHELE